MRVAQDILSILDQSEVTDRQLVLPGELDRAAYICVDKVLQAAGGKWNRKARAHLFDDLAADVIDSILLTGQVTSRQQELGYFPTPPDVVDQLLTLADLRSGMEVLEPSAGQGAIAAAAWLSGATVDCVEIDARNADVLRAGTAAGGSFARCIWQLDFLLYAPPGTTSSDGYDRVLMNPPFARQQDIAHVTHALKFLKPDGLLVSVMAIGVQFRQNSTATRFREIVDRRGGWFEPLADDSFKVSGTGVRTVIAVIPAAGC